MPLARFSNAITRAKEVKLTGKEGRIENPKVEMACKSPKKIKENFILSLSIMAPPISPPKIVAIIPKVFATPAMSVLV